MLAAIERGDYGPGDALPSERALCDMLGVSRVSVREAIAGLEALGVVSVQHGRGCFVTEGASDRFAGPFGTWLTAHREQIIDLLKVRGSLDELAAAEAARRQDDEAIAEVRRRHDRFVDVAQEIDKAPTDDIDHLITADVAFHNAVAAASGMPLLETLIAELAGHIADSRRFTLSEPGQAERSAREHTRILNRIVDGDAAGARKAAGRHVQGVIKQVLRSVELPDAADATD